MKTDTKRRTVKWGWWIAGISTVLALCCCLGLVTAGGTAGYYGLQGQGPLSMLATDTAIPTVPHLPTSTARPTEPPAPAPVDVIEEPVQIYWFVGLGTGSDPEQVAVEERVVAAFNASHPGIELILEVFPYSEAQNVLANQIASGYGPDIVGPVGWYGTNAFEDQWLDLRPYVEAANFDLGQFERALVEMYQTDDGLVSLPYMVFPAAVFYVPEMFDAAGLNYPPAEYGRPYLWPDGREVEWSWQTLTQIARRLTLDVYGNNATSPRFDASRITQYGYSPAWGSHPSYLGSFWGAGTPYQGRPGNYTAVIPDAWQAAWEWYYDGMWGEQPFIPIGTVSDDLDWGNTFNSGQVAMTVSMSWYLCCLRNLAEISEFQFAALPSYNGVVHGRVDSDSFRIWKGTPYPEQAFEVLTYLTRNEQLIHEAYSGLSALSDYQDVYIELQADAYPFIYTWDTLLAGLEYPDIPNAEASLPNHAEAWGRLTTFGDWMTDTPYGDLDRAIERLRQDLEYTFNE
ncbi:MAG: extracellular solute-binding protein [Anaerolineales bacterium]|nr:extracellular solute-binding protein [Anaerolineales bacterium]